MSTVCDEIGNDILRDCDNRPAPGIEQKVILIPTGLLPPSGITFNVTYPKSLIDDITLTSGSGKLIEGIGNKRLMNFNNTFTNPADAEPGYIHLLQGIRILNPSVEARDEINKLTTGGGNVFAVIETKWKGENQEDAFHFYGLKWGLTVPDGGVINDSEANDGSIVITLQTPEGFKEPYLPHVLLETNYATTKTAFDNKFAAA